ncbi:MAG: hypothetical protein Q4D89_08795 [Arachnia propionica]|uniref:hypothetical protein n=1 Tax=Arachnia propionica TaxID=1750 RepID=UPI0026FF81CD|nr:hypothetical protein [Arachnia propionica]
MAIHQPLAFLSSMLVGWVKQLPLAVTMLEVWLWAFVIATVTSVGQAAAARPGVSFWEPLFGTSPSDSR